MTDAERKALVERLSHELTDFMNPFGMSAKTAALCVLPIIDKLREADGKRIEALEMRKEADHANINLKVDFIDKTLDQLAAADQRIAELEAALARIVCMKPAMLEWTTAHTMADIANAALGETK